MEKNECRKSEINQNQGNSSLFKNSTSESNKKVISLSLDFRYFIFCLISAVLHYKL